MMAVEDEPIAIKFSHDYPKLGKTTLASLLDVWVMDTKEFSSVFVNYDTIYVDLKGIHHYPLPKGKVLVLLLHSPEAFLFTTIRRHTPQKEDYYKRHIGELVKIEVKNESN